MMWQNKIGSNQGLQQDHSFHGALPQMLYTIFDLSGIKENNVQIVTRNQWKLFPMWQAVFRII